MKHNVETLKKSLANANNLHSMVKTMKSLAAVKISRFEEAVNALQDYNAIIERSMIAYLKSSRRKKLEPLSSDKGEQIVIIFGTDLGMVGNYNDDIVEFALNSLENKNRAKFWVFGEKVEASLSKSSIRVSKLYATPDSLMSLKTEITQLIQDLSKITQKQPSTCVSLCHFKFQKGMTYGAQLIKLLPFDHNWYKQLESSPWSSNTIPEVVYDDEHIIQSLIQEFLFVKLFRTCAEAIMAENTARLRYMQHSKKKIEDMIEEVEQEISKLRQSKIDTELFEIISSSEALLSSDES